MILFTLFSCKPEERKAKDLSEIMPYSKDEAIDEAESQSVDSNDVMKQLFESNGIYVDQVNRIDTNLFPSRFGAQRQESYSLLDAEHWMRYHKWTYSDSAKVMNAFFNWIDCFGNKCKSIYVGEEKSFQNTAFMLLVGDSSLIFIEGDELEAESWYAYHDSLGYTGNWYFAIEQSKGRRAKWYTIKDGDKIKYTK